MKLTDRRFWIAWLVLLLMAIVSCMAEGRNEDSALLGAAYALLLNTILSICLMIFTLLSSQKRNL